MTRRSLLAGLAIAPILRANARAAGRPGLEALSLASDWVGPRVDPAALKGRAVLVDVFTFECINCVRVTPNLERLYAAYARRDLAVVAVHTPEVPSYQGTRAYVAREARSAGLPWPIALDDGYRIWNAYGVSAWPTQLVFDRNGRLHATIVGDSRDDAVARAVRAVVRA